MNETHHLPTPAAWYTIREVMERWIRYRSRNTIIKLIRTGKLKGNQGPLGPNGNGVWFIQGQSIIDFLDMYFGGDED